jgi:hypothetical protein
MKVHATRPRRELLVPALLTLLLALAGGRADAQPSPLWDHYKVYDANPKITLGVPVTLRDQFMVSTHQVLFLDRFANPVQKEHGGVTFPINRPELHYTWWAISPEPFSIDVIARNQFGNLPLHVGQALYLLNPANKNAPAGTPLPVANHYKCYDCTGDPVNAALVLTDQFMTRTATSLVPRYFCTPVEKQVQEGTIYPMVDSRQHYTVYEIPDAGPIFPATISDQFVPFLQVNLSQDRWLMVPTDKAFPPTDVKSSTWGRVKSIYR